MATFNSDIVTSGQAYPVVYPGTQRAVVGSVVLAANTQLATNDTLPLFYACGNSSEAPGYIYDFWLDLPAIDGGSGLTLSLLNSNTTPTTIINASTAGRAGGWLDETNAVHATVGTAVPYISAAGSLIYLKAAAGATNTSGASALTIYFGFTMVQA